MLDFKKGDKVVNIQGDGNTYTISDILITKTAIKILLDEIEDEHNMYDFVSVKANNLLDFKNIDIYKLNRKDSAKLIKLATSNGHSIAKEFFMFFIQGWNLSSPIIFEETSFYTEMQKFTKTNSIFRKIAQEILETIPSIDDI